jgi:D-threonate/D-erythronate kinase
VSRSPRVALVADDLTSAADGAAPFRAAGLPALITLHGPGADLAAGVLAVDLDTRVGPATAAGGRTARAVAQLAGADVLVKTMDSTVRGHLATEIEAALSASGRTTAVIAPAFPAEGRTTVGGVQLLGGRPVHGTAFARDPGHPVRDADLTRLIPGAVVAGERLARLVGGTRYVVADASCDRDLDDIVAAVPDLGDVLWVGSPGLASALARRLAPARDATGPGLVPPTGQRQPGRRQPGARVLVVVGSLHPASRGQATRLGSLGAAALVPVAEDRAAERVERQLAGGTAVLHGPEERTGAGSVLAALAQVTALLAARRAFDALVLTGGETARAVLLALGTATIALAGQPEPGVPLGLLDRPWPLPVALKAGGFGDRDTLIRLNDLLARSVTGRDTCTP